MKSYQFFGLFVLGVALFLLISYGIQVSWNEGVAQALPVNRIDYYASMYVTGFFSLVSILFVKPIHQKPE